MAELVGPFGFWHFPILTALFNAFQTMRERIEPLQTQQLQTQQLPIVNKETWEWTDYKGSKQELIVHRRVEYGTTGTES